MFAFTLNNSHDLLAFPTQKSVQDSNFIFTLQLTFKLAIIYEFERVNYLMLRCFEDKKYQTGSI